MFKAMLRGLLAHKLRLLLSALAIILGTMFMSGAFIAGDTIAQGFTGLFSTINSDLDVQVTGKSEVSDQQSGVVTATVPQSVADTVGTVDGVEKATPQVASDGARVIGDNGKVIPTSGPPRLGVGWTGEDGLLELRDGTGPTQPNQVALSANLAEQAGKKIGDQVQVITLQPEKTFTVAGIFGYEGGRDSLAGEMTVAFTMPVAQELMLGKTGAYTSVDVRAASGVSDSELKSRIEQKIGPGYDVRTNKEATDEAGNSIQPFITVLKTGLTVFALIALIVAIFLIFNTFSILVAQRTRELALYRSFGASKQQVLRSVLTESALLGLVAALAGLIIGCGVGWLGKKGLEAASNTNLPVTGIVVKPYVVIVTLLVGVLVTVISALVPALRASRVPPIAAMREAAVPDKPLKKLTIAGLIVLLIGVAFLVLRLTKVWKDPLWLVLGGGALLVFIGVIMLAPVLSRPVTRALGALFGTSVPARLGTRNTGRNPRRTALTAAALMIGVTLATAGGVFASSAKAGLTDVFTNDVKAQLIVQVDFSAGATAGFDPGMQKQIREIPGVTQAAAYRSDTARVGGQTTQILAGDPAATAEIFTLKPASGDIRPLTAGEIILDDATAKRLNATAGSTVDIVTARGGPKQEKVVATLEPSSAWSGPLLNETDAAGFTSPNAQAAYVQVASDDQIEPVRTQLESLFADNKEVTVVDQSELLSTVTSVLDIVLVILNIMLGLAIVVALLGVVNTLLLSIYERTREIGMIRAIGLSRGSTARMITVESILISVFGALLGMVVGVGLGVAAVKIFGGDYLKLTIPWGYLIATLILAIVAGILAAVLPAIRASRLNVLEAIAYE
ncbi:FtsX-like permease family protein [Hamadaea sp. NPDC051192]|uniref:ABC transporter permease n=1 Tax=Hamadaea sp. NPDC051192 TaxID=3154940 RepID=UPI003434FA2D